MDYAAYMREQAEKYRKLAERLAKHLGDSNAHQELLELAETCEHVAANIEEQSTGG
jgi:signal transduction protein with GAF and PtsI domain